MLLVRALNDPHSNSSIVVFMACAALIVAIILILILIWRRHRQPQPIDLEGAPWTLKKRPSRSYYIRQAPPPEISSPLPDPLISSIPRAHFPPPRSLQARSTTPRHFSFKQLPTPRKVSTLFGGDDFDSNTSRSSSPSAQSSVWRTEATEKWVGVYDVPQSHSGNPGTIGDGERENSASRRLSLLLAQMKKDFDM